MENQGITPDYINIQGINPVDVKQIITTYPQLSMAIECCYCGKPFEAGQSISGHETATWHTVCDGRKLSEPSLA